MTTRGQVLRSTVTGNLPAVNTRLAGELWTNFPDFQLGVIDTARTAQKLLAVRFFSTLANYAIGDVVVQAGALYTAAVAITAGPFNAANWTRNATMGDAAGLMPIAGGIFTGPVTLFGPPTTPLMAATKAYVDAFGGGLAAQFVDVAGDTMTGMLTIRPASAAAVIALDCAVAQANAIHGYKGGVLRWSEQLGVSGGETGANGGSDYVLYAFNDVGTLLGQPITITRASGYLTINGYGAPLGAPSTSVQAGNAGIVLNALAGKPNFINATKNGVTRWQVLPGNSTAEGGANTGCDFSINAFGDSGSGLGTALTITRANLAANFGAALGCAGTFNARDAVTSMASSGSQNPIVQCMKSDGVAVARMYTLGTGNVAYIDNPTTGVQISLGGQLSFSGNATFLSSVGINGTLSVAGATNVAALTSTNHQVNGGLGVTGGISMNGGINYNWIAANTIRFGWDSANTMIIAGVDATSQGNIITSFAATQVRGMSLNGGNQNMYAYYGGSNVHWAFVWNREVLEETETEFDALAALNSLNVKAVRFQEETDDPDEPEKEWPVAITRTDLLAKMGFAAVASPKMYPDQRTHQEDPEGREIEIPPMQTSELEFKTEPMIAALVRAVQQLTARVAELEAA